MMTEIAPAEGSVHFETFLWKEGNPAPESLMRYASARAGVTVRVLLDATGTKKMAEETEQPACERLQGDESPSQAPAQHRRRQ